ncbi:Uncharacterised protein [Mycobacteroides abscessus subsp. massiliense]|nr:Uncharacterised protein [Mycobacteroides abscessus subsp. massiliense]
MDLTGLVAVEGDLADLAGRPGELCRVGPPLLHVFRAADDREDDFRCRFDVKLPLDPLV